MRQARGPSGLLAKMQACQMAGALERVRPSISSSCRLYHGDNASPNYFG
jgi:hypothetical protein